MVCTPHPPSMHCIRTSADTIQLHYFYLHGLGGFPMWAQKSGPFTIQRKTAVLGSEAKKSAMIKIPCQETTDNNRSTQHPEQVESSSSRPSHSHNTSIQHPATTTSQRSRTDINQPLAFCRCHPIPTAARHRPIDRDQQQPAISS